MRRAASIIIALLLPLAAGAQDYAKLDTLLMKFYATLAFESVEAKTAEFNGLIAACRDSLTRQHVANRIFEHYQEPPLMGDEEVAVNIYDKWFASGIVHVPGQFGDTEAKMFADFNRATLIGREAPEVTLKKPCGRKITLPATGRCSVLFFHDTSCAKCKLEAKVLPGILDSINFKVDFYAVYCGSSRKDWASFRKSFRTTNRSLRITHLWDPEIDSDYIREYSVISTPRMYLLDPEGTVIGRRLEPESLQQMLPIAEKIQQAYEKTQKHN